MRSSQILFVGVVVVLCASALAVEKSRSRPRFSEIPQTCETYSVTCTQAVPVPGKPGRIATPPQCTRHAGIAQGAQAWIEAGNYTATTGWNLEKVSLIPGSVVDLTLPFAAGFLEGSTFVNQSYDFWMNYAQTTGPIYPVLNESLANWVNTHIDWVWSQVATNSSTYWQTVGWFFRQMEGFAAGYNSQNHPGEPFDFMTIFLINIQADIWDIWNYLNLDELTPAALHARNKYGSHCSSFIKWTPDGSDLYSSHTTWSGYSTFNRIFKIYNFSVAEWPGQTVLQSGYPLTIASVDDYYQITETQLMATETTLAVFNPKVYANVTMYGVVTGIRAPLANRLAVSAEDWVNWMGQQNTGTYNNAWIVTDYKLFKSGEPLDPNVLWVSEQMPGYYYGASQTHALQFGIFPSYNMAMYPETQVLAGMAEEVAKYGVSNSFGLAPRAQIFRRQGNAAISFEQAQSLLRYNDWQHDPIANGSAYVGIASRGDLDPTSPSAFGAIDGKLTNSTLIRAGQASIISGPTHEQQPVFCWSTTKPELRSTPHAGSVDCFDFEWIIVDQNVPCGYQPN